ncbi:MAG TPA: tetratricopeptide repeat protein [Thermoanaerobaculia bacterium]|nr:tetratricopeptide repeat protein [Thermoanaerobaculia bacterium]
MKVLALLLLAFGAFAQEVAPPTDDEFSKAVYFGKKFADMGDYTSAYDNFVKAEALKPESSAVIYNMAVVLARAGRYVDAQVAVEKYQRLFANGPEKPQVTRLQLELDFQRELQKKRQADQEYSDLFNRARFVYGRGELAEALRFFKQAEAMRPDDPAAVYNQALVLEKQGELEPAIERYRRYAQVESDAERRQSIDERVYALQRELDDMRTKIVCSFCGHKLAGDATWCHRCWHGPYLVTSPVWNSRPCVDGASATRATYFADERFNRNDILPCMYKGGTARETLRYSAAKQKSIQEARRGEGWTYMGDVLQNWSDRQGNQIRYVQGPEYLEKITSTAGGEILTYVAHAEAEKGHWLLDREDLVIDAQRYTNRYTYGPNGRIAQQQVDYQNTAACNHLVSMTADYNYDANDLLQTVTIKGGYEGFLAEGAPKTDWNATIAYTYDEKSRVAREELSLASLTKTYQQRPHGELREEVGKLFGGMRVKKPLENIHRTGDLCATSGSLLLSNQVDLRPFYALSPNLNIALQNGVTRAVVTFTYPDSYAVK